MARHRTALVILLTVFTSSAPADPALDALIAAYPDQLASYDDKDLIWKDGTRMPLSSGDSTKSFEELLDRPDIKDQFVISGPDVSLSTPSTSG